MANTYYDSELTAAEIEAALEAINGVIDPSNNNKVLAISNGKIVARSVQWSGGNLQEKTVTQNGIVLPDSGYDGLSKVTVNVSGGGGTNYADALNFEQGNAGNSTAGSTTATYPNKKESSNTEIRCQALFPIIPDANYTIAVDDTTFEFAIEPYNWNAMAWGSNPDSTVYNLWLGSKAFVGQGGYIAIMIRKKDQSNITPSEIANVNLTFTVSR